MRTRGPMHIGSKASHVVEDKKCISMDFLSPSCDKYTLLCVLISLQTSFLACLACGPGVVDLTMTTDQGRATHVISIAPFIDIRKIHAGLKASHCETHSSPGLQVSNWQVVRSACATERSRGTQSSSSATAQHCIRLILLNDLPRSRITLHIILEVVC